MKNIELDIIQEGENKENLSMWGRVSWTIKKTEHWRIDPFELWCWRRLLRDPWTARRSKSILTETGPEYLLEGLMLKLKPQYFGHLMQGVTLWKRPWFRERLKTRGEQDDRGWAGWIPSPTQWPWVEQAPGVGDKGKPGVLQSVGSQKVGHYWSTTLNWKVRLITCMGQ